MFVFLGSRGQSVGVTAASAGAEVKAAELCVGNAIPSRVSGGTAWHLSAGLQVFEPKQIPGDN